jgi:hypothetical protein
VSALAVDCKLPNDGGSVLELAGLTPGNYVAQLELGDLWRSEAILALGSASFGITAGTRTRATLNVVEAPRVEFAAVAGVVHVPKAWGLSELQLRWRFRGNGARAQSQWLMLECKRDAEAGGPIEDWRFAHDHVQVGAYLVDLLDHGVGAYVEVPATGVRDLALELGTPVALRVHLVDDLDDAPITGAELHWCLRVPDERARSFTRAEGASAPGLYELLAPEGELEMSVAADGYEFRGETVIARAPSTEVTLRIKRACGVRVVFVDAESGARIPFPLGWQARIEALGHSGEVAGTTQSVELREYSVTQPGAYTLMLPQVSGYAAIPDERIDVPAGVIVEHIVRLSPPR